MSAGARARLASILAGVVLAGGCGPEPPAPTRAVEITGEIRVPDTATPVGRIYVSLYHAWSLQGELRHPLQLIESFETAPGVFTHRFAYPEDGGEGLIVYAWVDVDGDSVLCTPTYRSDLAGLIEVAGFPADAVSVTVDLTAPCRGPDWFYPRASRLDQARGL